MKYLLVIGFEMSLYNDAKRLVARRSGGFLVQMFNRRTALELTAKFTILLHAG